MKIPTPKEIGKMTPEQARKAMSLLEKYQQKIFDINPYVNFKPNPAQARFLKAIDEGVRIRKHYDFAFMAGMWAGKTVTAPNIMAALFTKWQSPITKLLPLFQNWPFAKRIRIMCAPDQMNEFSGEVWTQICKWFPPRKQKWDCQNSGKHYPSVFFIKDHPEWTIDVRTFEQAEESGESVNVGLYIFDEPPPLKVWNQAAGRRKQGGIRVILGTFGSSTNKDQQDLARLLLSDPEIELIYAPTSQNFTSYSEVVEPFGLCRGYLDETMSMAMVAKWDENERDARFTGKPVFLSGAAFDLVDGVHYIPRNKIPDKGVTVGICDPHPNKPWFITVGRVDDWGDRYIIDQWPKPSDFGGLPFHKIQRDTSGVGHFAKIIKQLNHKWNCDFWIIDARFAAAQNREDDYAITLRNKLRDDYDLTFVDGNKTVGADHGTGSLGLLQELLAYDRKREVGYDNHPKLRIADDLTNIKFPMGNICWDEHGRLDDRLMDAPRSLMYFSAADVRGWNPPLCKNEFSTLTPEQAEAESTWLEGLKQRERDAGRYNRHSSPISQGRFAYAN